MNATIFRTALLFAVMCCSALSAAEEVKAGGALIFETNSAALPPGYKLLYQQDFNKPGSLKDFVMSDATAWKISDTNGVFGLELVQQSRYTPAVRSPFNIALIADRTFEDFILEADLMQTGREYGHRDMCLFFGSQTPTNFYYAHIATAADPHAHNIFIVNNSPRTNIAKQTTKGVNWGLGVWHRARLERKVTDGTIKVFFDDMSKPIMAAEDKTFGAGYVGFGSFDDTGMVSHVRIWGTKVQSKKTPFFSSAK